MTTSSLVPRPGKFVKGQSGNPAGRPKGSRNAISLIKLQVEGELRAKMKGRMESVLDEIIRQALPTQVVESKTDKTTGEVTEVTTILPGDKEMLKLLFKSWVSGTKASDEEAPKDKINIIIGKLDQIPPVNGRTINAE